MYQVVYSNKFDKNFKKFDKTTKTIILKWIKKHLVNCEDQKSFGKCLIGNLNKYWRYRIGNYRLLVEIDDGKLIIFAIDIEHRSKIYNQYKN